MMTKKFFFTLLIIPFLSNCTQYSAMLSPSITLASGGTMTQATTSLSSSLAMNKAKSSYMAEKKVEKICPTFHTSNLNKIFFETVDQMDCIYDPMSIHR